MIKKILLTVVGVLLLAITAFIIYYMAVTKLAPPQIENKNALSLKREKVDTNFYRIGDNWLKESKSGLWELYVEGKPFERGVMNGKLAKELIRKQENAFVSQIKKIVPSESYLTFLKYFVAWFNRNLEHHIPVEYQKEIYGVSHSASAKYGFIGNKYERILNYHAAHDIGHALKDKGMVVGCTAFSTWGNRSADSSMIIGRNFDFYVGDKFAEDKLINFYKPDSGHNFMLVSWGGMIGAVSGMNDKGLTMTLNAAKSAVPTAAATPISILAREILQYAGTIDEAYAIAQKRETFVSESIMIGSHQDHATATIEKSPKKTELYRSPQDRNYLVCSNHFKSDAFSNNPKNIEQKEKTSSGYRNQRMKELIRQNAEIDYRKAAQILRDQKGLNGKKIGWGNEKAINQLIAHHSIIFKPSKKLVWVSTNPYQLGEYVAYDLDRIFTDHKKLAADKPVSIDSLRIPADDFLTSGQYKKYKHYKSLSEQLKQYTAETADTLPSGFEKKFIASNPAYYKTYSLLGDYYRSEGEMEKAVKHYKKALNKEIPRHSIEKALRKNLKKTKRKVAQVNSNS